MWLIRCHWEGKNYKHQTHIQTFQGRTPLVPGTNGNPQFPSVPQKRDLVALDAVWPRMFHVFVFLAQVVLNTEHMFSSAPRSRPSRRVGLLRPGAEVKFKRHCSWAEYEGTAISEGFAMLTTDHMPSQQMNDFPTKSNIFRGWCPNLWNLEGCQHVPLRPTLIHN